MNFRVIENSPPRYTERYEEFIELYNESALTVEEIRKRLDWTHGVYNQAKTKAVEEGKLNIRNPTYHQVQKGKRVKEKKSPKYYSKTTYGKYVVVKRFYKEKKNINIYCGAYDSEDEAKRIVEGMKQVGWDKKYLNNIRREVLQCKNR